MTIASVDELMDLLRACAGVWDRTDRAGDPVDILDHDRQCAQLLRRWHPEDEELQVAGLLHDIGHHLRPGDDAGHGRHGAEAVRGLLGERVARLVELHVPAKRYLVATDAEHAATLSAASRQTLLSQGGAMDAAEIAAFRADPDHAAAITLRKADDAGKVVGLEVEPVEHWRPVLERVAAAAASTVSVTSTAWVATGPTTATYRAVHGGRSARSGKIHSLPASETASKPLRPTAR
ncbi:HD domain-containing protein [Nocardia takedensis]|uniref:HD domain-containing protein n=1 Tax=Nocardia takedensis TaxID=259390 RepID=UPI00030D494C